MRITQIDLESQVKRLNRLAGTPQTPYKKTRGYHPQPLHYHLDYAYGGVALYQMCDTGSGVHDILNGHMPKKELYALIHAYILGLQSAKE